MSLAFSEWCMWFQPVPVDQKLTGEVQADCRTNQTQPKNEIFFWNDYVALTQERKCIWCVAGMYEKRGQIRDRMVLVGVSEGDYRNGVELTVTLIPPITPIRRNVVCIDEGTRNLYTCSRLNGLPSDGCRHENHSIGTQYVGDNVIEKSTRRLSLSSRWSTTYAESA